MMISRTESKKNGVAETNARDDNLITLCAFREQLYVRGPTRMCVGTEGNEYVGARKLHI